MSNSQVTIKLTSDEPLVLSLVVPCPASPTVPIRRIRRTK